MDKLIQALEISAKLKRAHKSLTSLFPKDFYERVDKLKGVVRNIMEAEKCDEYHALVIILKDENMSGVTQVWFMATVCEMIEPSRPIINE